VIRDIENGKKMKGDCVLEIWSRKFYDPSDLEKQQKLSVRSNGTDRNKTISTS